MKKGFAVVFSLLVVAALAFTGCSKKEEMAPPAEAPAEAPAPAPEAPAEAPAPEAPAAP